MVLKNAEIRKSARAQLKGNWGRPIAVFIIYFLIAMVANSFHIVAALNPKTNVQMSLISIVVTLALVVPLIIGVTGFSIKFMRNEHPEIETMFDSFKYFFICLGAYLWYILWISIWMLLFIIPGIIKVFGYSMMFYIIADNPKIGVRNALTLSKKITKGSKGKIFLLGLSFVGWVILALISFGIGFIWLYPYMMMSHAKLYDELKKEGIEKGIFPRPSGIYQPAQ